MTETAETKQIKTKEEVKIAVIACARSVNLEGELSGSQLS